MKTLIYLFLLTCVFASCEGYTCTDGIVKDKNTNLPLDSVLCMDLNAKYKLGMYTDSTGKFDLCGNFGGCGRNGCPDINVEFSKAGYKTISIVNPGSNTTIFMEK